MKKVSVIVPVYNAEKYLRQCLDSLINQTYKNLEIICIDDCSTDLSYEILKEYQKKDSRVKIYQNSQNLKSGLTRNRGIELATGDYIHFVDADDWLELGTYERLVGIVEKFENIQVIQFMINIRPRFFGKKKYTWLYPSGSDKIFNLKTFLRLPQIWHGYCWNKFCDAKFIKENNIKFNDYPCFEDCLFNMQLIIKADYILNLNEAYYNYRVGNPFSITACSEKYLEYLLKQFEETIEMSKSLEPKVKEALLKYRFDNYYDILWNLYFHRKISYKEFRNWLFKIDYSIFSPEMLSKSYFVYSNDVMNLSQGKFLAKTFVKYIMRKTCPKIFDNIVKKRQLKRAKNLKLTRLN